ncbi:MAG TPA: flavin reductase family protein [Gemmatimonadales bacterium]|nr:flavin reductase family protein [Gemmatimonadales bacterium]
MTAPVDPTLFRQLLGRFATGVTVITTRNERGEPVGMTASSLTSVSLSPPLISVCVDVTADMHRALTVSGAWVINILAADQREVSARFAEHPPEERFRGIEWETSGDGHILLAGTLAHISCERYADFPLGDHTLFVGRVTGGAVSAGEPLLYYRGQYGTLAP